MRDCSKSIHLANKSVDMIDAVNKGYNEAIKDIYKDLYEKLYCNDINDNQIMYYLKENWL